MKQCERWWEHVLQGGNRPKKIYEYYVSGKDMFPIDMLRFDGAWPASGEDAAKIEWGYSDNAYGRIRSVKLRSYREPTLGRWSSFNWSVGIHNLEKKHMEQTNAEI